MEFFSLLEIDRLLISLTKQLTFVDKCVVMFVFFFNYYFSLLLIFT